MTAVLLGCAVPLFVQGEPSAFHNHVESRLVAYFGTPTIPGSKLSDFLAKAQFPPGFYKTSKGAVLFGSSRTGFPMPWDQPGVKTHRWYTNNYRFTVYYSPDNEVLHTEMLKGIRFPRSADLKKPPEKK
jgi:hypothetical protein